MDAQSPADLFVDAAQALNIPLPHETLAAFEDYFKELCAWNAKVNLTRIIDPKAIYINHFVDSLTPERFIPPHAHLIDIGSGAGFPGIPLKIIRPDILVTLIDSALKRVVFQRHIIRTLRLKGIVALQERAEHIALPHPRRVVVISRAFSSLLTFLSVVIEKARIRGRVIAMKGPNVRKELDVVASYLPRWSISLKERETFSLPFTHKKRTLLVFE